MHILFVSHRDISPQIGGIEHITGKIAEELRDLYQAKCYLAYYQDIRQEAVRSHFDGRYRLVAYNENPVWAKIIGEYGIEVVIVQQLPAEAVRLRDFLKDCYPGVKLVYVQHDCLSVNQMNSIKNFLYYQLWEGGVREKVKAGIKLLFYPFYKPYYSFCLKRRLLPAFNCSDRIVVLSQLFLKNGIKFIGSHNLSKVVAINNCLTLDRFLDISLLETKCKEVLIVSRLYEDRKRLSAAFKIWKQIEQSGKVPDWKLIIVGSGESEGYYRRLVKNYCLRKVCFEGQQVTTEPYYERASLFMMTSDLEGWGLTLTEAQQMGVVPLAFDSFEALHEIIKDGENGCIIPENNIKVYVYRLLELMLDSEKRKAMAVKGIDSVRRFTAENIIPQWKTLIETQYNNL